MILLQLLIDAGIAQRVFIIFGLAFRGVLLPGRGVDTRTVPDIFALCN
jgi:hypothetical protein